MNSEGRSCDTCRWWEQITSDASPRRVLAMFLNAPSEIHNEAHKEIKQIAHGLGVCFGCACRPKTARDHFCGQWMEADEEGMEG